VGIKYLLVNPNESTLNPVVKNKNQYTVFTKHNSSEAPFILLILKKN